MNEKNEINKEKDLIVCEKQEILGELDAIKEQI